MKSFNAHESAMIKNIENIGRNHNDICNPTGKAKNSDESKPFTWIPIIVGNIKNREIRNAQTSI